MLRLLILIPAAVLALHAIGAVLLRSDYLLLAGGISAGILWLGAIGWWWTER